MSDAFAAVCGLLQHIGLQVLIRVQKAFDGKAKGLIYRILLHDTNK